MPDLFAQVAQNPGITGQQAAWTPEMDGAYQKWRSDKIGQWIRVYANQRSGSQIQPVNNGAGQPIPKLETALKMYQEDNPGLRQMFLQEQRAGQQPQQ